MPVFENQQMKRSAFIILLISIIPGSCSKNDVRIDPDNLLIGVWNHSEFKDNTYIYTRSQEFIDDHCYKFNNDGTLVERKNSGWCGTPPVTYGDYSGTWSIINDTLIQVTSGYWGGSLSYMLDIESLDSETLKIVFIYQDN